MSERVTPHAPAAPVKLPDSHHIPWPNLAARERAPGLRKELPMPDNHLQKQVEQDRSVREGTIGQFLRLAARRAK